MQWGNKKLASLHVKHVSKFPTSQVLQALLHYISQVKLASLTSIYPSKHSQEGAAFLYDAVPTQVLHF